MSDAVTHEEPCDHSSDHPFALDSQASQAELAQQQRVDLQLLEENIGELLRDIKVSFDKKLETFTIEQAHLQTEDRKAQVHREYLALTLGELNAEAFLQFQQLNLNLSLCVLKKAAFYCKEFRSVYPDIKELFDWSLILDNNISFLLLRMGMSGPAKTHIVKLLDSFAPRPTLQPSRRPTDEAALLEERYEKIRVKRVKIKLLMSLCLIESEAGNHEKAIEHLRLALDRGLSLVYDTYIFCYHHLLKKDKSKKICDAWDRGADRRSPAQEEDAFQIHASDVEENLTLYVLNAIRILEYVTKTLQDNGFDNERKRKTVDLMRASLDSIDTFPSASAAKRRPGPGLPEDPGLRDFPGAEIDLHMVYEYFGEEHWLNRASVMQIMQHRFMSMDDPIFGAVSFNEQISPETLIEKLSLLVVCFYALSTESRFQEHLDNSSNQPKQALIHKETTEIVPRFQEFRLSDKHIELDEQAQQAARDRKLRLKQLQINQAITNSEFLLGLAVQLAYLFLDPQMPFVNQVFVVFRAFYLDQPTAIMENEDQLETAIFLKPFRGSRASKAIIPVIRRKKPKNVSKVQQHLLEAAAADLEAGEDFEDENRVEPGAMARTQGEPVFRSAVGLKSHSSTVQPFFRNTAASFVSKPSFKMSKTQPDFGGTTKQSLAGSLTRQVIDLRLLGESNPVTVSAKDSKFTTFYKMTTTKRQTFVPKEADLVVGKSISSSQLKRPAHKPPAIMPVVSKINMGFADEQQASLASQLPTPRQTQRKPAHKHAVLRLAPQAPEKQPRDVAANKYHVSRGARTSSLQSHLPQPLGLNSSETRMPRLGRSKGSTGTMGALIGQRFALDARAMQQPASRQPGARGGQSDRQHVTPLMLN